MCMREGVGVAEAWLAKDLIRAWIAYWVEGITNERFQLVGRSGSQGEIGHMITRGAFSQEVPFEGLLI